MTPDDDAVERYLDDVADNLRGQGREVRRVLAEVEQHLDEATADGVARGLSAQDAGAQAVARFGDAAAVARGLQRRAWAPPRGVLLEVVTALVLVLGVGLVAVGASGALAWGAGAALGKEFVAGDAPGVTYTPARCAEYFQLSPGSDTCVEAATSHHFDEVTGQRIDVGVLGVLVLGVWAGARRWVRRRAAASSAARGLPDGFAATVGAALFGAAAVITLPGGILELILTGPAAGAGNLLSAGVVSLAALVAFTLALSRSLAGRLV
jgi:hypothetical protein